MRVLEEERGQSARNEVTLRTGVRTNHISSLLLLCIVGWAERRWRQAPTRPLCSRHHHHHHPLQEILDICFRWTGSEHLDIDDIFETPAFRKFLNRERTLFERPGQQQFLGLIAYVAYSTRPIHASTHRL
jgi:hypothetical protein